MFRARSPDMKPVTEEHLALFRRHMVEIIDMHLDLSGEEIGAGKPDPQLRRALMDVPRHLLVPQQLILMAYQDSPLPIGFDKTISQPFIGALMIHLLAIESGLRVLEVGMGLGYQAALMAEMGAQVWSVEVVEEFAEAAETRFAALGYSLEVGLATARGAGPSTRLSTASSSLPLPRSRRSHCSIRWQPAAAW